MTNEEIKALAIEAADCAIDAHGVDGDPGHEIAYDFIRNMIWEKADDEAEPAMVWESLALSTEQVAQFASFYEDAVSDIRNRETK